MRISVEERQRLLAKRLREEREKQNISQIDLAFKAGLSQNIVALIETGKRIPNVNTVFKISEALDISPVILFEIPDATKEETRKEIISLLSQLF